MFKYLEKLLGKPMKYYETLMASKSENANVTASQVHTVVKALEPLLLHAIYYDLNKVDSKSYPFENKHVVPLNKKDEPLTYCGSYIIDQIAIVIFVDLTQPFKSSSKYKYYIVQISEINSKVKETLESDIKGKNRSAPIWEEIIHRFPDLHHLIVSLNPKHPWTLYKKAVEMLEIPDSGIIVGGYPQWVINDVDFRKLKKLKFLMSFKEPVNEYYLYFFENILNGEIIVFEQKK